MPINGFVETYLRAGTINTSHSFTAQHNFASPLTVWSHPYLQGFSNDDGFVRLTISQFKDASGTNNVSFRGLFATNCTSITFLMETTDCVATAIFTTYIF